MDLALRGDYSIETFQHLFEVNHTVQGSYDPAMLTAITFADESQMKFSYNSYGEVAAVTLPTGGRIEYDYGDYGNGSGDGFIPYSTAPGLVQRRLQRKREYADGSTLTSLAQYVVGYTNTTTTDTDTTYDATGNVMSRVVHSMNGVPTAYNDSPIGDNAWNVGEEYQTVTGAGTTITTNRTYQQSPVCPGCSMPNNPHLVETDAVLNDTDQQSKTTFGYDNYNNVLLETVWDFGPGAPGQVLRQTSTAYNTDPNYLNLNLVSLPTEVTVKMGDGSGTVYADTRYGYDENALANCPNIVGHDNQNYAGSALRGNVTSVGRCPNPGSCSWLTTTRTYDIAGNVVIETDPKGHPEFYSFNDGYADSQGRNTYAFLTSTTDALTHVSMASYDYGAGKAVSQTDANRVTTRYAYNDALDRLTQVRRAVGSGSESQSNYVYPNAHTMLAYQDKDATGDRGLQSQVLYDGFGRAAENDTAESGSQLIATCRTYDALGAVQTVSNPFRATGSAVCPGSGVPGTSYVNDSLGRSYRVIQPDGTYVESDYQGNGTTVTDEAGHTRKTIRDVLGRVVLVYEDLSVNNYQTSYRYDPLGDLVAVTQGAQQRTFGYDGLQRLRSATNPESGTVNYTYDAAGNLQTKTDARGVTTTYTYDALNRPLMKQYSGEASGIQTQPVTYSYDTNTNGVGRLASVSNGNSTTSYPEYDALGRIVQSVQTTGSGTYPFTYRYNLAGSLISETYPSGRVITTAYDGAGRASGVSGSLGGTAASYAVAGYEPSGAYTTIGYGNNVVQHFWYDNRLRPQSMRTAYQDNPAQTDLQLTNTWLANGNLQGQTLDRGAAGLPVLSQTFGYDGLNRLTASAETNASNVGTWARNYQSDQYGNTWITAFAGVAPQGDAPQAQGAYNPLTNQLVNRPFNYDSAGNQGIVNGNALSYDAENRLLAVSESLSMGGGFTSYLYDGDGRRVGKFDSSGNHTNYVYDAQGLLVAEYGTTAQAPCATCYLSWDQIGSTRLVTDQNGQVVARHDYLPFGEELESVTGRGSDGTNPNDTIRQKFTGKEHDQESGLDYFGARYYGGAMGRFTGVDPAFESAILELPQTWNRYSYVYNRPTFGTDPDGRCPICVGAIVGGVVEGGWNLGSQLYQNGGNLGAVSWGEVGANAFGGAAAGALAVATGGTSLVSNALVGDIVAGVGSTVAGGIVTRTANGESAEEVFSPGEISTDAVAGFVGGAGGHVAADFIHVPEEPTLRRSRNNNVGRRARAKYNAAVANRNSAMRLQAGVGVAAGSFPTHGTTGFLNNFWNIFDWFSSPPPPPQPSPPSTNGTTSTFTPCQAGDTTLGCT